LTQQMATPRTDLKQACAALSIPARQYGVKAIRPPVLAVFCERNILIGVGTEILIIEGHYLLRLQPGLHLEEFVF
jgi:hypothetical protein